MASTRVLPLANYGNGSRTAGPIDIGDNVRSVDFSIQRCTSLDGSIWPNESTVLEVIPEVSLDGGGTWIEAGRFKSNGGIATGRSGQEVEFTQGGGSLPVGKNRQFRVTAIITGGPLRSTATVEVN